MRKILIVSEYNSIYAGNFISSLLALNNKIKSEKMYETILAFPITAKDRYWINYLKGRDITIDFFDTTNKKAEINSLRQLIKKYNVSIIYAHFMSPKLLGTATLFNRKIKKICHLHSDFTANKLTLKDKIYNYILYTLNPYKINYISVSKHIGNAKKKFYKYIPNGLTTSRIVDNNLNSYENIFNNKMIKIVLFGWSPYVKGVDIAVDAMQKLHNKNVLLYIISGNDNFDAMTKQFNLFNNIKIIRPVENIYNYLSKIDVIISASRSEGFSYSVLEALSLGKTAIISDIAGTKWALDYDGVFEFRTENSDDLSKILDYIIDNNLIKYRDKVAKEILVDYSIDKWCESVLDVIHSI